MRAICSFEGRGKYLMRLIELFDNPAKQIKDIEHELNNTLYAPPAAVAADRADYPVISLELPAQPGRHFYDRLLKRQGIQDITPEELKQSLIKMHQMHQKTINRIARSSKPESRGVEIIDPDTKLKVPFSGHKNPHCLDRPRGPASVCPTAQGVEPKNYLYPKTIFRREELPPAHAARAIGKAQGAQ
jgi:hypothetical protein